MIMKKILFLIVCAFMVCATFLCSCNVTRKMTTEQSYFQRGDTATSITTKTVESYTAKKNTGN